MQGMLTPRRMTESWHGAQNRSLLYIHHYCIYFTITITIQHLCLEVNQNIMGCKKIFLVLFMLANMHLMQANMH